MNFRQHRIHHLTSTVFILIVAISNVHSQERSSSSKHFDTTGLVIRICFGDLPGQKKEPGVDYIPVVCAYSYNESKLVTYKVDGFDLVYKNPENNLQEVVPGKGNQLSIEMRRLINTSDTTTIRNFFLDNVYLVDEKGKRILVKGSRPFLTGR